MLYINALYQYQSFKAVILWKTIAFKIWKMSLVVGKVGQHILTIKKIFTCLQNYLAYQMIATFLLSQFQNKPNYWWALKRMQLVKVGLLPFIYISPPPFFVVRRILSAQRSINRIVEHLRYCFNGVNRATDRQDVFVMGGPISGWNDQRKSEIEEKYFQTETVRTVETLWMF